MDAGDVGPPASKTNTIRWNTRDREANVAEVPDAFGDEPRVTLTKDDEMAERVSALALLFMNARKPVTSSEVQERVYPNLAKQAADKAFNRDRKRLESCGIVVRSIRTTGGVDAYRVDERASFADTHRLTSGDALFLDIACRPLAADPSFPYSDELAMALAKVNGSFAEGADFGDTFSAGQNKRVATLRSCLLARHACRMTYEDARGRRTERTVAPFGTFRLRGTAYFVAAPVDDDGTVDAGEKSLRTFNSERVVKATEVASIRYEIPSDFYVDDHIRLPFQIGDTIARGVFLVPERSVSEVRSEVRAGGRIVSYDGQTVLLANVSCLRDAAAWAVAHGVVPMAPNELRQEWKRVLEEVRAR